jgi:hypothetical protein
LIGRGRQLRRRVGGRADASETYDLSALLAGFEQHPQQGWHVKLTVNNDGAQGADVKHKVGWVSGCETTPPTTTPPPTEPPTSTSIP